MFHFASASIKTAVQRAVKARNSLQSRTAVSLLSISATCVALFVFTGALYARNVIMITDGDNTYRVYTTQSDPDYILSEQKIALGGLDYYNFGGFNGTAATLSITRSHAVTVSVDGTTIKTKAYTDTSVGKVLAQEGVILKDGDIVTPALTEKISDTCDIVIDRTFGITVRIEGVTLNISVSPGGKTTLGEILENEGIRLEDGDIVSAGLNTIVYPGMDVIINTIRMVERVEVRTIPYEVLEESSNLLAIGSTEVLTAGVEGIEHVTLREKIVDGEVMTSEIIKSETISTPVNESLLVGKALAEPYSKRDFPEIELVDGLPVNYEYKLSGTSTAYTAGPNSGTASGRPLIIGTVAVDPRKIPYGSLLYIVTQDGGIVYGAAVAADTGGFIYSTDVIVDVYKGLTEDNYQNALNWGLRNVDVYVISTGTY
ncbi:MAG: ubiquitin-like domain-containing protein [Oscillospiraceae bacterium]|nr:ubiquitin-like domain-containing protein [Oscillospiraceae bacterium]